MKNFLLYGHGGSYNHGAEAIVQVTINIIRKKYAKARIALSTHFPDQDRRFLPDIDEIFGADYDAWEAEKKAIVLVEKERFAEKMYSKAREFISSDTVCLSVGGDNFCYPNWHRLAVFQKEANRKNAKSILWGCSVEPAMLKPEMMQILNSYTHILARESYTYEALREAGVRSNVKLLPDPAFLLEPKICEMPVGFGEGDDVVINVSPLVMRRETVSGILKENMWQLMDYILMKTNMKIILLPHVTMPMDNDFDVLSALKQMVPPSLRSRVWLVEKNHSAAELKSIIMNGKVLVCARSHAAVAAYSTGVPVLAIGYSVKSMGIAEDLGLGEFVVDVREIKSPHEIRNRFQNLFTSEKVIRKKLINKLGPYLEKTNSYSDYI